MLRGREVSRLTCMHLAGCCAVLYCCSGVILCSCSTLELCRRRLASDFCAIVIPGAPAGRSPNMPPKNKGGKNVVRAPGVNSERYAAA